MQFFRPENYLFGDGSSAGTTPCIRSRSLSQDSNKNALYANESPLYPYPDAPQNVADRLTCVRPAAPPGIDVLGSAG